MRLPATFELNDFNRMVIAINELSIDEHGCTYKAMVYLCTSVTFGGRAFNHREIFRLAEYSGLVSKSERKLVLTEAGIKFLELNPSRSYEINDEQKKYLVENTFFEGPWSSRMRDLFLSFIPDYQRVTFVYDLENLGVPQRHSSTIHLLTNLGVLEVIGGTLSVSPIYVSHIVRLRSDELEYSESDLDAALQARRKLGAIAEDAIVEFEKRRLLLIGCVAEAALVRKISHLNVSAGYDIESFNGDGAIFEYDRFIEVKSSKDQSIRFYWTANEYEVARKLKEKYWIYFVANIGSKKPKAVSPVMINDPAKRLVGSRGFDITPVKYLIQQSGEISIQTHLKEDLEWFTL